MGALGDMEMGERLPGIGVACLPAYGVGIQNPYLSLCYDHLAERGFAVVPDARLTLRWLWRRRGDVALLHFHWQPDWFYLVKRRRYTAPSSRAPRLRSAFKLAAFALRLSAARALGYRIVWTIHEPYPPLTVLRPPQLGRTFDRIGERILARSCHVLTAHHHSLAAEAASRLGLDAERIHVVPHGAYLDLYPPGRSRRDVRGELGIPVDAFVFLAFGTLRADKSIPRLLDAFRAVRDPGAVLLVAGRVEDVDSVRLLHAAAQADARIKPLPGFVPDDQVRELFEASDASVLARTEEWTSGSVILSLSLGVPVVCARLPAHEQLVAGGAGWLFDRDSADALTKTLEAAAACSAGELNARRLAAAEAARTVPTWSAIAGQLAALMREAIGPEERFEELAVRVWPLLDARSPLWHVFPPGRGTSPVQPEAWTEDVFVEHASARAAAARGS